MSVGEKMDPGAGLGGGAGPAPERAAPDGGDPRSDYDRVPVSSRLKDEADKLRPTNPGAAHQKDLEAGDAFIKEQEAVRRRREQDDSGSSLDKPVIFDPPAHDDTRFEREIKEAIQSGAMDPASPEDFQQNVEKGARESSG